ncbi:TAT-variant-translocated molybdopterin oxidoreductase [Lentisphaera profundi]|uniref:TAT-variant-translocated molybdopterin oxidoreductase n=1 Tax=Lentisphaera profundi TaxID=1658616 RepID=A0ABY7VS89_9BACT|nr:TAT-variant-translocated molybdopterin oxidoreductase [Lentisphaera profundi]WDE96604.1 TAT-variant-translocated molybdopterin oxidoreductase [Lentisphaera profundi]
MSQIDSNRGKHYWRSLDELAESPEFKEHLEREFPEGASELGSFSRRGFMKIMAASMTLAGAGGLTSCRRPEEKILPYASAPEGLIPGKARFYATAIPRTSGSLGILAKSHEGRPTKIDGLPGHPANGEKTDKHAQADLLSLYDPFRLQYVKYVENGKVLNGADEEQGMTPLYRKHIKDSWTKLGEELAKLDAKLSKGESIAILSPAVTSKSEEDVRDALSKKYSAAQFFTWEVLNENNATHALKVLTGKKANDLQANYSLVNAEAIVAVNADFMMTGRDSLRLSKEFADARRVEVAKGDQDALAKSSINRLYSIEANFSVTGSNSDHRYRLAESATFEFMIALSKELSKHIKLEAAVRNFIEGFESKYDFAKDALTTTKTSAEFISSIASDLAALKKAGKNSVILVGDDQSVAVQILGFLLNDALGNNGKTLTFTERAAKVSDKSLEELSTIITEGKIKDLLILGGNPAYDAPADLKFAEKIATINTLHLTSHFNETSIASKVAIPKAHFLEYWGDTRSANGSDNIIQPLIAPLFGAVSDAELLAQLIQSKKQKGIELVKATYSLEGDAWEKAVHGSLLPNTAYKTTSVSLDASKAIANLEAVEVYKSGFELVFKADYSLLDGSYNNNGWMQEFPDPITKLTWDNAALLSFKTANDLGVQNGDYLNVNGEKIPAWIVPGIADKTAVVSLGYGRTTTGPVGTGAGFNAYKLRNANSLTWTKADITKASGTYELASTQDHWAMEGRDLVKDDNITDFKKNIAIFDNQFDPNGESIIPDRPEWNKEGSYQWAMVVDLNACNGCGTCTISCQAENNISVVGKERVLKGREMHWIRMDRYFFSGYDTAKGAFMPDQLRSDYDDKDLQVEGAYHQPIPCMHCEKAPCELVCPVAATVHNEEGLNDMAYNRCIGTRYCGNNCPYKVRRFNFFQYQENFKDKRYEVQKMVHNPNVTVRSRGVMEKCTYCVQRINEAKIDAKVELGGRLETDSFTAACAQSCPTDAITFGDQNDPKSKVSKMQNETRNYVLLPELNARPRTSFLGRLKNRNSELG